MVDTISKYLTLKPLVSFVKLLYPLLLTTSQPGGHLNNTVNTVSVLISPHHQILDSSTQLFKVKPFLCTDLFAKLLTHFHFCPQTKISSYCQTPATYPPLLWSCTDSWFHRLIFLASLNSSPLVNPQAATLNLSPWLSWFPLL